MSTYQELLEQFSKSLLLRDRDDIVSTYYPANNPFYKLWNEAPQQPVVYGIDWAKPGSDRTVQWSVASDPTSWSVIDDSFAPAEAMQDAEQKRNAHIWNMIVLAAESSRYEK